jgi:serine/threonine-protein kinase
MADAPHCPDCGRPLPADVPHGACPACLPRRGLEPASDPLGPDDPAAHDVSYGFEPTDVGHVLETLACSIGPIPRVLLPDTDPGDRGTPPVLPSSPEMPAAPPAGYGQRYQLFGEIARGGMGAILRGRDTDLGRELAVKVLLEAHRDKPELVRRFVEEAQIGGQLQHPGIIPVYELGTFADRRPYFSMKLLKGRTLAALLHERNGPQAELPRFLAIFGAVCQTVAYAHARGVIHRDLKPSNVMVGGFGEVQVMDWGLAKVLREGGVRDEWLQPGKPDATVVATLRSGSDADASLPGSVLGTPAYMAPEQAAGDIGQVDRRSDVFGLVSILCEVLTGRPAFTGPTQPEVIRRAMRGQTAEALAALDGCGAEPELTTLARDCLAVEPNDRPRDAGVLADRLTAYLAGGQEKLRRAELERVEERAHRRLTTLAAAAVVLLSLSGAMAYAWSQRQHAARVARTERAIGEALADAERLRGEALAATPGASARWADALSAIGRAEGLASPGEGEATLLERVDKLRKLIEHERDEADAKTRRLAADRNLLAELDAARGRSKKPRHGRQVDAEVDAEFAAAFRRAGLDLDTTDPAAAGHWLAARSEPVELISYLDSWANERLRAGRPEADWRRLVAAARAADPDPWRDALRARIGARDAATTAELRRLADDVKALDAQPAPSLNLLASLLWDSPGDRERAARVLRRAVLRHSSDYQSHVNLSLVFGDESGYLPSMFPKPEEAERHLSIAVALRPERLWARRWLSWVQELRGKKEDALDVLREAVRIGSDDLMTRLCRWDLLFAERKLDEALAEIREILRREPEEPANYFRLGQTLLNQGKNAEALEAYREAVRRDPRDAMYHNNIGLALWGLGRRDEAVAAVREAIRLRPDWAVALSNLGGLLAVQEKNDEALGVLREAMRRDPEMDQTPYIIGRLLRKKGDYAGAIDAFRKADALLRKDPIALERSPGGWTKEIRETETLAGMAARLPALLKGDDRPRDNSERLALAQMCNDTKRYAAAARFWGEAMAADPKVADDRVAKYRGWAARAAALAAAGKGEEEAKPGDVARAVLRRQALDWLRADLAAWAKTLDSSDPKARASAGLILQLWTTDSDLAGIRDPDALNKLSEAEQRAWRALWADVENLLKKARP